MATGNAASASPTLCRLRLRMELRRLRQESRYTGKQVADELTWSTAKITRIETTSSWVEPTDTRALCQLYKAGPELTELLVGYATVTKTQRDWWQSKEYRSVIQPGFSAYLGLEESASQLRTYQSEYVPGLFQTEAYIRRLFERTEGSPEDVDRRVAIRMNRQNILTRAEERAKIGLVINEAVLRRIIGSRTLMREQLEHMAALADLPNVKLQVVPFAAGGHPGMNGSFTVLTFKDPTVSPIVYMETMVSTSVIDRPEDVERYDDAWSDLQGTAASRDESLKIIMSAAKEL